MSSRKKAQGRKRKWKREQDKQEEEEPCIVCTMSNQLSLRHSTRFCRHGHDNTGFDPEDVTICERYTSRVVETGGYHCPESFGPEFFFTFVGHPQRLEIGRQILVSAATSWLLLPLLAFKDEDVAKAKADKNRRGTPPHIASMMRRIVFIDCLLAIRGTVCEA